MRNVCVTGWYYPVGAMRLCRQLEDRGLDVTVIAHRPPPEAISSLAISVPDIGLEFGSYSYYLKHVWAGGDTLLMHDDIDTTPETIIDLFVQRDRHQLDMGYVWRDMTMAKENGFHHGRAIMCSHRYLDLLSRGRGIWFDADNHGQLTGPGVNRGCHHFWATAECLAQEDPTVKFGALVAPIDFGFRGILGADGRANAAAYRSSSQELVHA